MGRQREDRELEKVREAEARRATKELMAAQRQEEELRLKRNIEDRAREKAEEARAREKIRVKLGARREMPPLVISCRSFRLHPSRVQHAYSICF